MRRLAKFSGFNPFREYHYVDCNQIVRTVLGELDGSLSQTRLEVVEKYGFQYGRVYGDPNALSKVFRSVIFNAIEAMSPGGVLGIQTSSDEGTFNVYVSDTGVGMGDQTRQLAFEPFFSKKKLSVGSGLGLSDAYRIIAEHRGGIDIVSSELDIGTVLEISLPYVKDEV
ncbi:sensor histidine kinase [Nanoarchaeota archaeon]